MATLHLYFDKRQPRKDGTCPLKMALNHNHKTVFAPLDTYVLPEDWDDAMKQVTGRPDKKFLNILIRKRMAECTIALQRILLRDDADTIDTKRMLDMVMRGTDTADTPATSDYLLPVYNDYIASAKKANTAAVYRASLKNLTEYAKDIDTLRFKDISVAWLRKYQRWLTEERGMDDNGANVYLRNLRCIFNYALKNDYTSARYPFKDIDMTTKEPAKRSVKFEQFLEWVTAPMGDHREYYRDLFMLSFYLCGIRPVDLLHVKKSQIDDGRLVYWPEKLNGRTKLSIKIEPEAWEIIRKYEGEEYLLEVMESRTDYKAFMQHWNRALKAIGKDEKVEHTGQKGRVYYNVKHHGIVPYISVYYSRSCWASYAYDLIDTPMDVISQALGHRSGKKITNFYVKRDIAKVDKANRELIDRVKQEIAGYKASHGIE